MATASDSSSEQPESGLKCRQCRAGFLVTNHDENHDAQGSGDLFILQDDDLPDWIMARIEEVSENH